MKESEIYRVRKGARIRVGNIKHSSCAWYAFVKKHKLDYFTKNEPTPTGQDYTIVDTKNSKNGDIYMLLEGEDGKHYTRAILYDPCNSTSYANLRSFRIVSDSPLEVKPKSRFGLEI